jgi:sulfur-oxidizing protein SoxX
MLPAALALTVMLGMPEAVAAAGRGDAQEAPLIALDGAALSAETGAGVFVDRDQGHCVLCHRVASLDAPFQGDVGPALDGIGSRLTPSQIRYRIVDVSRLNPDTIMPPYYRTERLTQVAAEYRGRPALSAEQIEQLVHYLAGLKE